MGVAGEVRGPAGMSSEAPRLPQEHRLSRDRRGRDHRNLHSHCHHRIRLSAPIAAPQTGTADLEPPLIRRDRELFGLATWRSRENPGR